MKKMKGKTTGKYDMIMAQLSMISFFLELWIIPELLHQPDYYLSAHLIDHCCLDQICFSIYICQSNWLC